MKTLASVIGALVMLAAETAIATLIVLAPWWMYRTWRRRAR